MRIGTNHGSLSDRIMSRYGDTAMGMVESAMEFLRISRDENYHNIVLSMKSSNPLVMVQAYRLLVQTMRNEFGEIYPLHLGVTEAGDGEDGRIKSAIGIGTLLEDGVGDTIRVSLTEDPEFEIPVCKDLVKRYVGRDFSNNLLEKTETLPFSPFDHLRRVTYNASNIGGSHVPVVVADFMKEKEITRESLNAIGYKYDEPTDKWNISDAAADYIYTADNLIEFALPGSLQVICDYDAWLKAPDKQKYHPLIQAETFLNDNASFVGSCYIALDCNNSRVANEVIGAIAQRQDVVLCVRSSHNVPMPSVRNFIMQLMRENIKTPVILVVESGDTTIDEQLIHFSAEAGALFLDGMGDGIWLMNDPSRIVNNKVSGRTYLETRNNYQFINNTSFSILQATRTRISKTEYISCPSCGRTLFDLQETTAKIRAVTNHLKGVKIAIMGCIVNGPGEMADADFGYVGSGPGKITLYKGKDIVKRSVNSDIAVEELINILKENGAWIDPVSNQ
jgi:(E)-4-hydroxy-3-methylbut-2-enyl-diphosphate synthase